jgi:hypothetical protein
MKPPGDNARKILFGRNQGVLMPDGLGGTMKVALLAACVSPAGGGISEIVGQLDRSLVAFDGVEVA